MKLPTYNGWPIIANFSPIEGKWYLKTRRKGIPCGVIGKEKVPLKECLGELLRWLIIRDNFESEKPYLPVALCDCGKGYKMKIENGKLLCAYCGKEIQEKIK